MIKKNTRVIFEDNKGKVSEEFGGGMPLSKGEIVKIHKNGRVVSYIVKDKMIDCFMKGKDKEVNIVYTLKRVE